MSCGTADILDIACTNTALTGDNAIAGGLHLAREKRLQRCHTGADQKQCWIVFGYERITGQPKMVFFLCEKLKICFSQLISSHIFQRNRPPKIMFVKN